MFLININIIKTVLGQMRQCHSPALFLGVWALDPYSSILLRPGGSALLCMRDLEAFQQREKERFNGYLLCLTRK